MFSLSILSSKLSFDCIPHTILRDYKYTAIVILQEFMESVETVILKNSHTVQ
jgi:hypothetical protein